MKAAISAMGLSRVKSPGALKRQSSMPMAFGSTVRRGRELLSDEQRWGNSGRLVQRRIEDQEDTGDKDMFKRVVGQLRLDQAAMLQMQGAIDVLQTTVNTQVIDGYSNIE
jgi:hypothetical protein